MIWTIVALVVIGILAIIMLDAGEEKQNDKKIMQTLHEKQSQLSPQTVTPPSTVSSVDHSGEGGTYVTLTVVGINHRTALAIDRARKLVKHESMMLEAEPNNVYDHNAIKVLTRDGFHVGYLRSKDAEKVVDIMDSLVDCFVEDIFGCKDITLRIRPFFRKESPLTLSWLINHWSDARDIYEEKYPGFNDQTILADSLLDDYCDYIKNLYLEHQDDAFLEYLNAKMLFDKQQFEDSNKLFMDLINDKRLIKVEEILYFSSLSAKGAELVRNGLLKSTLKQWFADADLLMVREKYDDAVELFLDCLYLGLHQQSLPRKICKCYEASEQWCELHEFANKAYQLPWISEATSSYLLKRI